MNLKKQSVFDRKCIVAPSISNGTKLIINDCYEGDDKFILLQRADKTFRPKTDKNLCMGPSRTGDKDPPIELANCTNNSPYQYWTVSKLQQTCRTLKEESRALEEECSDCKQSAYSLVSCDLCLFIFFAYSYSLFLY